jgi:alpha-mannosidase
MSTGIAQPEISYGVPYGVSWTGNIMPKSVPYRRDEIPVESWSRLRNAIHWIDLGDTSRGVTVGSKHRCFRFEGGVLQAVMLRAVVSGQACYIRDGKRVRHLRPYPGRFTFDYCLLPHAGGWQQAKSYRAGWELSYPLLPVVVGDSASAKSLAGRAGLVVLESDTDSLVQDVVKRAEHGDDTVIRFHETEGRSGAARIRLPGKDIKALAVADLREREVRKLRPGDRIPYKAFEIVTLRVSW